MTTGTLTGIETNRRFLPRWEAHLTLASAGFGKPDLAFVWDVPSQTILLKKDGLMGGELNFDGTRAATRGELLDLNAGAPR